MGGNEGRSGGDLHGNVHGVRTVGSLVGERFLLKAHLGRGRDGELYEAVDRSLSDPHIEREHSVVLHILSQRVAQQTGLLQKLETSYLQPHSWAHPNVVKVVGFGCDQGEYFFVTEALEGATLRTVLDETSPELPSDEETFGVLCGVGNALKFAHAKRVVHGDVRPESIFVTTDLGVKVLDLLPASLPRTLSLFPEDTSSSGGVPDPRDDVYGLACVAYELFTRRHPFNSNTALEALSAGLTPASIPRLGAQTWDALARGLALRREQRTASVAAFLAELGVTGRERLRRGGQADGDTAVAGAVPARASAAVGVAPVAARPGAATGAASPPSSRTRGVSQVSAAALRVDDDSDLFAERRDDRRPKKSGSRWSAWVVALVVGAAAAAYWNFERLQVHGPEWLAMARSLVGELSSGKARAPREVEREATVAPIEATGAAPGPDVAAAAAADRVPEPASAPAPAGALPPVDEPDPRLAEPTASVVKPPVPETFEPESPVVVVSEGAASAAVTVRRRGDGEASSSVVWWTSDGTAVANDDYVDLGAQVEKFAAGEQARTIHIPIVHDSKAEGRESFYVNLRPGQSGKRLEPPQRVEVVIADDD